MFQAALAAQGQPPARVIPWRALVEPGAPARLLAGVRGILRIDSMGEDEDVERLLIVRGGGPSLADVPHGDVGRILAPRAQHDGLLAVLAEIEAAIPPGVRVLQPPSAIRLLFDKAATSAALSARGIPVPDVLPGGPVRQPDDLRARMVAAGWPSVFVKLTSGSSASCLAVFVHRKGDEHVMTTVEDAGHARYNTRRIQRLTDRTQIDRTLGFILGEGAHVERAIPKARVDGRIFDLRVLAIDGVAAFVVMRTSPHPITNLHLGAQRGDVAALRARVPDDAWEAAMASCVATQQASGAFHVGVDLMLEPGLERHRVIEGNAFGDFHAPTSKERRPRRPRLADPQAAMHRDPALEAAIAANPDDTDAIAVYGDWLAQRGEPLGELIALSLAARKRPGLEKEVAERAALFEVQLLGGDRTERDCCGDTG